MKWTCFFLLMALLTCTLNAQSLIVKEKKGQYGFFIKNKKVLDYQYDATVKNFDGSYAVNRSGRWGLVNPEGKETIACQYDTISQNFQDGYLAVLDGKFGIVSENGQVLLSFEYDDIDHYYQDSIALVKKDGKWGYLTNGQISSTSSSPIIFRRPERMPLFILCPGVEKLEYREVKRCADKKMLEFIYRNIRYPEAARKKGTEGDVIISFLISDKGEVKDPTIVQDIGDGCGEESLKVVQSMPQWIPGYQDGKAVWTQFFLPIRFRLS